MQFTDKTEYRYGIAYEAMVLRLVESGEYKKLCSEHKRKRCKKNKICKIHSKIAGKTRSEAIRNSFGMHNGIGKMTIKSMANKNYKVMMANARKAFSHCCKFVIRKRFDITQEGHCTAVQFKQFGRKVEKPDEST